MTKPAPLTPPDCDLRGMPYMELDIVRLLDSDFFAMSTGDEFKAGVALWGKSWNQVPAASLPTDDRILGHLAGVGRKDWPKVKEMALHGWIECDDGRLYHPTVAEKALKAWGERQAYREDKSSEAERKAKERQDRSDMFAALRGAGAVLAWNTKTSDLRAEIAARGLSVTWTNAPKVTEPDVTTSQTDCDQSRDTSQPDTRTVTAKRGRGNGNGTLEEDIGTSSLLAKQGDPIAANDAGPSTALALVPPPSRPAKVRGAKFVPEDWQPSAAHIAKAADLRVNLDREVERFRLHEFKDPKSNFDLAFHRWLNNAADGFGAPPVQSRAGGRREPWNALDQAAEGFDWSPEDAA